MNEIGIFNTNETKSPTNKDIIVVFSPSANVKSLTFEIYKNNEMLFQTPRPTITLKDTGTYIIKAKAIMNDDTEKMQESDAYIIDKEGPIIEVNSEQLIINKSDYKKIKENAKVTDNYDENLEISIKQSQNNKTNLITYTAVDSAGNTSQKNIIVKYNTDYKAFMLYGALLIILSIIAYFVGKYRKAIKIENRLEPFIVKPVKNESKSISEKLIEKYNKLTKKISKKFDKSPLAQKYTKKLEKYLLVTNIHKTKEDILAGKIIVGFIFLLIAMLSKIITLKFISGYEIVLIFTFGFFVLDILYFIKYKIFRWKIESDFIAAITIMNNSFKSGRSITQSIDTVAEELKGYIGEEFKRMSLELLYGLEIDVVFERFAKRIELEEANYLTASLTILNKTGGDIIKVFNSIERNMFDKRKLRLELASLTSGSKIVVATLLGMPFFFALVISMINKDYFLPLITTSIGRILLIIMIIYYIIFVVVVRKIMKVVI